MVCGTTSDTGGKCKAACVAKAVQPKCTSCTSPKVCKWTCNISATAIPDADLYVCTAENTACGSTSQTGQCKSTCATATGKNGSIKCGLSPLIMICGALAMLFLRP
ncbi:uncharacterized protein LOC117321067 [Pecten maximus]|uniref:uncharacterized protein LOC117321067 n=1 Tax=Pecten maximus TaxID=6579 RepID=UPI001458634D|nr:uncharacterized protein LOC117321067 [Pecten maximus]